MSKQAERIINKFGGARVLARLMGRPPSTVYKWTYDRERGGTGGIIPFKNWDEVKELAVKHDVDLLKEDFYP